jgi:hypothetical protein
MKRRIRLGLGEVPGTPGWEDPLGLEECLLTATDHVARMADCYQTWYSLDITGSTATPQAEQCMPHGDSGEIYKLKRVRVELTTTGDYREFRRGSSEAGSAIVNAAWMSRNVPEWTEKPASGLSPDYIVLTGTGVLIYPLPTWTKSAGIRLYGFATPGRTWDLPSGYIDPDEAVFPLPSYALAAVETYARMLRCEQFPSKENMLRYNMIRPRFEEDLLPDVCQKAAQEYNRGNL